MKWNALEAVHPSSLGAFNYGPLTMSVSALFLLLQSYFFRDNSPVDQSLLQWLSQPREGQDINQYPPISLSRKAWNSSTDLDLDPRVSIMSAGMTHLKEDTVKNVGAGIRLMISRPYGTPY